MQFSETNGGKYKWKGQKTWAGKMFFKKRCRIEYISDTNWKN